jgi:DNA repair ATPase RecN
MVDYVLSKSDTCTSTGESIPVIAAEVNTLTVKSKAVTLSLLRWRNKKQTHENLVKELKVVSTTTCDPIIDLLTPDTALEEKRRRNTELKTYLREGTHNETVKQQLLEKIEHNIFSNSIITMKSKLGKDRERYEEKYKGRREEEAVDGNEEELLVVQERLQQEIYIKDSAEKKLKKLSISLGECVAKLVDLRGKLPKKSMTTLRQNIVEKKKQVELLLKKQVKYTRILHKIETFKIYASERERQKKLKEELKTTKAAAKEMKDRTTGAAILRTKIKEAEGLCLLSFVQSIQGEVQMYLDEFFSKDPLSLRLSTQKISKKGTSKPEINITMDYKGRECDPFSLSGGELQRVILAFTLAFTERFNLPFLLLDECTSNLDQELTSEVVHVVKKYQHSRPILLVAHQVVLGIFDKVVNI